MSQSSLDDSAGRKSVRLNVVERARSERANDRGTRRRYRDFQNESKTDQQLKDLMSGILKSNTFSSTDRISNIQPKKQGTRRAFFALSSERTDRDSDGGNNEKSEQHSRPHSELPKLRHADTATNVAAILSAPLDIVNKVIGRHAFARASRAPYSPDGGSDYSPSVWRSAHLKMGAMRRADIANFNKAFRLGNIWKQDVPGEYTQTIYYAGNITFNRLLLKMVATKLGQVYHVKHNTKDQHTLSWDTPIVDPNGVVLPPGSMNLYRYPMVQFRDENAAEVAGRRLEALRWLMHKVAEEPQRTFFRRDASGAMPMHALAISNTSSALQLIRELGLLWPRMIVLEHGPGLYIGEHLLHILAVNRRELELCEMLSIAHARLARRQWLSLLATTPDGIFFLGYPMSFFGLTITGFAAAFGLKRAIHQIISFDQCDPKGDIPLRLTDPIHACPLTGFLPLHCAVANGQIEMFDFLVGANHHLPQREDELRLPSHLIADVTQSTVHGLRERWSLLTPLQLAAKLGDQRMTRHIIRKRLALNWKWGPLHSYRMNLDEIDSVHSSNSTDCSMVELSADFTAVLSTQRFLLDEFMHGFLYSIIRQKWMQFTRYVFYTMRAAELVHLVFLNVLCFHLKKDPIFYSTTLATVVLVMSVMLLLVEMTLMVLWWRRDVTTGFDSLYGLSLKLDRLWMWSRAFSWRGNIVGFALSCAASIYYLSRREERQIAHSSHDDSPLYLLFAISSYLQGKAFISTICVSPSLPKTGVQMFIIEKMFLNDVTYYLYFLAAFTINYYLAMFISIPTNADAPSHNLIKGTFAEFSMDNPATGLNSMVEQAIIGLHFAPDWYSNDAANLNAIEWLCFIFFYLMHLYFVVVCIILLLRLLMAMMTNTFRTVQESAQLEWRLLIARHVLRFELFGAALFSSNGKNITRLLAGTKSPIDNKYYYHFQDLQAGPGEPKTIPMQLAQQRDPDPLFDDDTPRPVKPPDLPALFIHGTAARPGAKSAANRRASEISPQIPGKGISDGNIQMISDDKKGLSDSSPATNAETAVESLRLEISEWRDEFNKVLVAQRDLIEYHMAQIRKQVHEGLAGRRRESLMNFAYHDDLMSA